jgi:hypothetical protein
MPLLQGQRVIQASSQQEAGHRQSCKLTTHSIASQNIVLFIVSPVKSRSKVKLPLYLAS